MLEIVVTQFQDLNPLTYNKVSINYLMCMIEMVITQFENLNTTFLVGNQFIPKLKVAKAIA